MENIERQPAREQKRGWLALLLSVLAGPVTIFIPFGLCAAPALWAYAGARTRPYWIALPALVYVALAFVFYPAASAAGLAGAAVLAAALLYVLLTHKMSNTYVALTLSGVFLVGLYAAVCLPGVIAGRGAFADAQAAIGSLFDFYREAIAQTPGTDPDTTALVLEWMDAFYAAVPSLVVAALSTFAGLLGLGNLLFFRLFCRKHPEISISPMRAFRDWSLPRSMTLGLFVLLIGSLILEWVGWTFADGLSSTVNVLVGMPLLLQGLCVVDFLIARSEKKAALTRPLVYTGIGVLFAFAQTPLILIGCFDQIFRFRDRLRNVPPRAAV